MGTQDRGLRQKLEAQFCRKYGELITANDIVFFVITQIQANTSGYGAGIQAKMGNSIRHQADINILARASEFILDSNENKIGHNIVFKVECSAMGKPQLEMKIPLRYGYGIDDERDIMDHAITWGLIKKASSWFTTYFDENGNLNEGVEGKKIQGENSLYNYLLTNRNALDQLDAKLRQMLLNK
jgi:hypothetical protein